MQDTASTMAGKVAQVNLAFWIVKIFATTVGETGGDALSMGLNFGYAASTAVFFGFFLITVTGQILSRTYRPSLYWAVIVATTMVGTTTSDFLTRSAGLGYTKASLVLFGSVLAVLAAWRFATGTVSVSRITTKKAEAFYWLTILASNTLGTALGDFFADDSGFGYTGSAMVFTGGLIFLAGLYFFTKISRPALFWSAFILTRPLGATVGDLLTKAHNKGGLELSQMASTLVLIAAMIPIAYFWSKQPEAVAEA